jgi:tRNA A-37 threonylcarbamoyl transferase component Bud32
MSGEREPLKKLTESIADGEAVDWDELRALVRDDDIKRLLDQLRIVAGVAEVHRSQIDETQPPPPPRASTLVETQPTSLEPQRWGHLLLIRKIGEGAFGEVYEALDTWLDHPRALKLLKPEIARGASASHILHEARKLVRVRHPNVVMVHGADSHDGRIGFWMDLIEGQTLEQRVHEGRLSAGEATYVGQELCRALAAVHQANLLHRDVKAQNVMRASDGGRIILMDFGAGEFRGVPSRGRPLGTPLYLAPEIVTGKAATVQTDIYALGVLMYYLVTGQFPVIGTSFADIVLAHARGVRQHLRDARPDLPDGFVNIVERAIDPDPTRRFQSAGDFHASLEERDETRLTPRSTTTPSLPAYQWQPNPQAPLAFTLIFATSVAALIAICGLVTSRTFDVALRVDPSFVAGPAEYVTQGTYAVLPFAFNWLAGIAIVTVLTGLAAAFRGRLDRFLAPWNRWRESIRPATLATMIPVCGATVWLAMTWWAWPIFDTLWTLQNGDITASKAGSVLDPGLYTTALVYSQLSATLTFALLFAVWRWWPWIERRADDFALVRRMRWVSVAVILAIVIAAVAPRRVYFEKFEVVLYKNQPSLVIGSRGDELLLLPIADPGGRFHPRVRRYSSDYAPANGKRQSLVGRE